VPSTPTTTAAHGFTPEQQAAAKRHVCEVFDASTAGQQSQGGLQVDGNPNSPLLIRKLTSIVAIQNALSPQTPPDVGEAAQGYLNASLELMSAAMGSASVDDINRLTSSSNDATYALADVCGLSH
jgi:hypothetical protein